MVRMLLRLARKLLSPLTRPAMVWGFRHPSGRFLARVRVGSTTVITNARALDVADDVFIGHFSFIESSGGIQIGTGCQITNFVSVLTHSSHDAIRLYGPAYSSARHLEGMRTGPVSIGAYTFVGPHTVIMPGTRVGKGCLVTAYSYLDGQYPDYSLIAGNPANVVGSTTDRDARLLEKYPELREHRSRWAGQ